MTDKAAPHPAERRQGPLILRRQQVEESTTDQRLLDSGGRGDWVHTAPRRGSRARRALLDAGGRGGWVHTDPWRVLRIQAEFVEGFGSLAELGPAISVFGSARTRPDDPDYALGETLGGALARAGFAVITGGGPGVMEAAN